MRRQVSPWVAVILIAGVVVVLGSLYYFKIFRNAPSDVDFTKLDPRDPYGMLVFKSYDDYYRQHPEKRPRNWPPEQFRPENIARLQEESHRITEEQQRKLSEVTQQYLRQQGQNTR